MPLLRGCGTADWNFIRKRRRSSIARMSCGSEDMTMRSSIFWGMNFAREDQRVALVRPFSTSVQRFPPRQQRRFGRGYEAGNYPNVVIRRSKNCLDSTIRSSGAGSNITGGFTARRSTRSNVNWTKSWSSGPKGNTKSYANISGGHDTGLLASRAGVQSCLLTGRWHVTRLHDGSCMSREAQVQFCERLGVRFPGATLPPATLPNPQEAPLDPLTFEIRLGRRSKLQCRLAEPHPFGANRRRRTTF